MPLFIGTSGATTVLGPGYDKLKAHLGIEGGPQRWFSKAMQYTWMDEEVLVRLGSDGRAIVPGPAESVLAKEVSDDHIIDAWGTPWRRAPDSIYFEIAGFPLRNATHRRPGEVSLAQPDAACRVSSAWPSRPRRFRRRAMRPSWWRASPSSSRRA